VAHTQAACLPPRVRTGLTDLAQLGEFSKVVSAVRGAHRIAQSRDDLRGAGYVATGDERGRRAYGGWRRVRVTEMAAATPAHGRSRRTRCGSSAGVLSRMTGVDLPGILRPTSSDELGS